MPLFWDFFKTQSQLIWTYLSWQSIHLRMAAADLPWLGLSQSLLVAGCLNNFTTGLSKRQQWHKSRHIGGSFHQFGICFLFLTTLMREFIWLCDIVFSLYALATNNFMPRWILSSLASATRQCRPPPQRDHGGQSFLRWWDRCCQLNDWSELVALESF